MTRVWLFGEMEVDMSETPDQFFKRASYVAEQCGYIVERNKYTQAPELGAENIIIYGQDSADNTEIVNYVNVWENKLSSLQKVLYSIQYKENKTLRIMHKVYTYKHKLERWELSFDADQLRQEHNTQDFIEVLKC